MRRAQEEEPAPPPSGPDLDALAARVLDARLAQIERQEAALADLAARPGSAGELADLLRHLIAETVLAGLHDEELRGTLQGYLGRRFLDSQAFAAGYAAALEAAARQAPAVPGPRRAARKDRPGYLRPLGVLPPAVGAACRAAGRHALHAARAHPMAAGPAAAPGATAVSALLLAGLAVVPFTAAVAPAGAAVSRPPAAVQPRVPPAAPAAGLRAGAVLPAFRAPVPPHPARGPAGTSPPPDASPPPAGASVSVPACGASVSAPAPVTVPAALPVPAPVSASAGVSAGTGGASVQAGIGVHAGPVSAGAKLYVGLHRNPVAAAGLGL